MKTKKDRRNSGRVITKIYNPVDFPYEFVFWDDWNDVRDGMRDLSDRSLKHKYIPHYSYIGEERYTKMLKDLQKIKKQEILRKLKKNKRS